MGLPCLVSNGLISHSGGLVWLGWVGLRLRLNLSRVGVALGRVWLGGGLRQRFVEFSKFHGGYVYGAQICCPF